MKSNLKLLRGWGLAGAATLVCLGVAHAFPPAPSHLIYGMVRGELGDPITATNATVVLTTSAGTTLETALVPNQSPGQNYRLVIPMDSGITADAYKPTALRPTVPFQLSVTIGNTSYLPIEMSGNLWSLGQPAGETRLDLTLGEDTDGDGLPDAWERAILALLGGGDLSDINPGDDSDGDGLSNLNEYIAGTYAFDPEDGYSLGIVEVNGDQPVLEFTAIKGRSYSIIGSSDLKTWSKVSFNIPTEGEHATYREVYQATDVRTLRVESAPAADGKPFGFYRLIVE